MNTRTPGVPRPEQVDQRIAAPTYSLGWLPMVPNPAIGENTLLLQHG